MPPPPGAAAAHRLPRGPPPPPANFENLLELDLLILILENCGLRHLRAAAATCLRWHQAAGEVEAARAVLTLGPRIGRGTGAAPGQLRWPAQVAALRTGGVFVADSHNSRVVRLGADTEVRALIGVDGGCAGEFSFPKGVACDGLALYVADTNNCRVQKLTLHGAPVGSAGSYGHGDEQMFKPHALALASGRLFVSDLGNNRIVVVDAESMHVRRSFGRRGAGPGQLNQPRGLAAFRDALIYVADSANHRICCFTLAGEFVRSCGGYGRAPGQFSYPSDVAVDDDGLLLFVVEPQRRVQVLRAVDGLPLQLVDMYYAAGQLHGICMLAAETDTAPESPRQLYVGDRSHLHVLYVRARPTRE